MRGGAMSRVLVATLVLFTFVARNAQAWEWSLGSHLGVTSIHSDIGSTGTTTVLGWPATPLAYEPGLRVALGNATHTHEFAFDAGLLSVNAGGSTLTQSVGSFGYQYAW